ncbi:TonB-dependent receptor domain-containing protein [Pseudogemmobacter faecipullorum]|uniref:TonB-dependent receptor n=1 Tax=Pseudogemmobacter faecipullorum TaxID=2755041 RepID=A0ABS8CND0_9RHOB|nr:TonB-dependent receptor [Pseudogemmobacter faecipullorum]MCB5410901.1 TonB-dependent receptor [Pseudogemmobacter faecipullorum]
MSDRISLRAALLSSVALLVTTQAFAQERPRVTEPLGTVVLETRRDVQTQTATAVTEIDQEELDDRQASTIAELVATVPGVTLVNGSTPLGSGINIRGFGGGSTYGSNQKVMITIDGATQGSEEIYRIGTQLFTDPELYKRVEVIRGTVGSFEYGSGVVGGLIQLETKDASDFTGGETGYKLRQALSFGTNGDGITSSTTLAWQPSEDLEFLASYIWRRQGKQVDGDGNLLGAEGFKTPSYSLKGKYTFGASRDQSVTLSYTDTQLAERDVPYDAISDLPFFGNVDRDMQSRNLALTYRWNPDDNDLIDLTAALTYADQEILQTGVPAPGNATTNADLRYETTKLTVKNTALFALGTTSHELRTGFEVIRKDRLEASSAPGGLDERLAFFVIDEVSFGNGLTLTPALRYETQDIDGTRYGYEKYSNDAVMGGLSARYEFTTGVAIFGSAAYTEALPILDDLTNINQNWGGWLVNYMTTPEKSRTFEIGASYRASDLFAAGDAISVKGNYYNTDTWDVTSESGLNTVTMKGLEIEGAYSMANGFYGELSANIVDGSSRSTAWVWNDYYKFTPTDTLRLALGKRWDDTLDLSWEVAASKRYDEGDATAAIPGNAVHALRATYRPQEGVLAGTEMRFGVENLFDRDYQPRLATRDAPGRNIKFTIAKTF